MKKMTYNISLIVLTIIFIFIIQFQSIYGFSLLSSSPSSLSTTSNFNNKEKEIICEICYKYNEYTSKCEPVEEGTDPNNDCAESCGVKMVCNNNQICHYPYYPTCNCDWDKGICLSSLTSSKDNEKKQNQNSFVNNEISFKESNNEQLIAILLTNSTLIDILYEEISFRFNPKYHFFTILNTIFFIISCILFYNIQKKIKQFNKSLIHGDEWRLGDSSTNNNYNYDNKRF